MDGYMGGESIVTKGSYNYPIPVVPIVSGVLGAISTVAFFATVYKPPEAEVKQVDRIIEKLVTVAVPYEVDKLIFIEKPVYIDKIVNVSSIETIHIPVPYEVEKLVYVDKLIEVPVEKVVYVDRVLIQPHDSNDFDSPCF